MYSSFHSSFSWRSSCCFLFSLLENFSRTYPPPCPLVGCFVNIVELRFGFAWVCCCTTTHGFSQLERNRFLFLFLFIVSFHAKANES